MDIFKSPDDLKTIAQVTIEILNQTPLYDHNKRVEVIEKAVTQMQTEIVRNLYSQCNDASKKNPECAVNGSVFAHLVIHGQDLIRDS